MAVGPHVGAGRGGGVVGARIDEYSPLARLRGAEGHGVGYREREPSAKYVFSDSVPSLPEMEAAFTQISGG